MSGDAGRGMIDALVEPEGALDSAEEGVPIHPQADLHAQVPDMIGESVNSLAGDGPCVGRVHAISPNRTLVVDSSPTYHR